MSAGHGTITTNWWFAVCLNHDQAELDPIASTGVALTVVVTDVNHCSKTYLYPNLIVFFMEELTPDMIEKYELAGKIAGEALKFGKNLIKKDALLLDVADKVERFILKNGAGLAFPVNISLNTAAAHYTPTPDDKTRFGEDIVKLDVGAHVDGYVGDTALTIDLTDKNSELVKASREALNNVIKVVKIGVTLGELGKVIEDTIAGFGFKPIKNLSGHEVQQFRLHAGVSIPNYDTGEDIALEKGMVIAIEPFASSGAGLVGEKGLPYIHSIIGKKPIRSTMTREVFKLIQTYHGLPFATRHITEKFSVFKASFALKEMEKLRILRSYPPLVDVDGGLVSQAEHTFMIGDKVTVLTKVD